MTATSEAGLGPTSTGPAVTRSRRLTEHRAFGVLVIATFSWLVAGPGASLGAVAVAVGVPKVLARRRRRAATRDIDAEIATVFELAARRVRAGSAVPDALAWAAGSTAGPGGRLVTAMVQAPVGSDGRRVFVGGEAGRPARRGRAVPREATSKVLAAVIGMVLGSAGGGARGLEAGAALLREHDRARGEIDAGAGHARASASLLIAVPLLFGVVSVVLVPSSAGGALGEPSMLAPIVAGIGMEALGAAWIGRLVRAALGAAG